MLVILIRVKPHSCQRQPDLVHISDYLSHSASLETEASVDPPRKNGGVCSFCCTCVVLRESATRVILFHTSFVSDDNGHLLKSHAFSQILIELKCTSI